MRTLRLSLVGAVTLALLGGLPALAQDPEKATWTHVIGVGQEDEWIGDRFDDPAHVWDGSVEYIPDSRGSYTVEWSDPRLPTTMRIEQNALFHHGDMDSKHDLVVLHAVAVRLEDPEGSWAGQGHGMLGTEGQRAHAVLTGDGAYDGLSALLDFTWSGENHTVLEFDGFIFESALPSTPDPLQPISE